MSEKNGNGQAVVEYVPELYRRYRPKKLDGLVGQPGAVKKLRAMITSGIPHALLLSGPSGCGKTTIARILRKPLRCVDGKFGDFNELNCAESRGIDSIREIQNRMHLACKPGGQSRIYLLDECFAGHTLVSCLDGPKQISEVVAGEIVNTLSGFSRVRRVFCNRVDLRRLVRLQFNDGRVVYTTKQHLFFTERGWIAAGALDFDVAILGERRYPMGYEYKNKLRSMRSPLPVSEESNVFQEMCLGSAEAKLRPGGRADQTQTAQAQESVRFLRQRFYGDQSRRQSGLLFEAVCGSLQEPVPEFGAQRNSKLSRLRGGFCGSLAQQQTMLRAVLREEVRHDEAGIPRQNTQRTGRCQNQSIASGIQSNRSRSLSGRGIFCSDARKQPVPPSGGSGKDEGHKGGQRDAACMVRGAWGQWEVDAPATDGMGVASENRLGLAMRAGDPNRTQTNQRRLSDKLQGGCGARGFGNRCRNRWEWTSIEKEYLAGCKEDRATREVRVASIEVYQPGRNDEAFLGVVGDRERSQGFVSFYDLEIDGHPSYFVEGVPVHNCHRLTSDAQASLLKLLEDPPGHVYFMLATTDPSKLLETIRTRCTEVAVKAITDGDLRNLVVEVAGKESVEIQETVLDKIVELAGGSGRKALVLLHQVIGLEVEEDRLEALESARGKEQAIELARALLGKKPWSEVSALLKGIPDDPEGLRRMIFSYAGSVLLNGGKAPRAAFLMEEFRDPFFDAGTARGMLTLACYRTTVGMD